MRDIILIIVFGYGVILSFRKPYWGPLLWVWVSMMNPHRLTWSFAYSLPFAQAAAACALLCFILSKKARYPYPNAGAAKLMVVLYLWMCVTSVFAISTIPGVVYENWSKVTKIQFMLFITLMMLRGREQIQLLVWVLVVSIGYFGVKGGLYTAVGGGGMVMGPAGSFIEGTNHIAIAMTMVVPFMYYLSQQLERPIYRKMMYAAMALTTLSVFGTTSRGALLAVFAMSLFLGLKGSKHKFATLLLIGMALAILMAVMPESWTSKMSTIKSHEDHSAQSRLYTWKMIWNLVIHNPLTGGGFSVTEDSMTWVRYAVTDWAKAYSPHSIYFQALAEHGFIGLFLYIAVGISAWRLASSIVGRVKDDPELQWASLLVRMCQASLMGFAVGGAFVNLVNFDLPYYIVGAIILVNEVVREKEAGLAMKSASRNGIAIGARAV